MKKKINKQLYVFALLIVSALLCCCSDDREAFDVPKGNTDKSLTFSVRIPVPSVPETYALSESDENEVTDIHLLLFNSAGTYTGISLSGDNITTDGTDTSVKTFTVKVPEGTYDMVILANANNSLNTALGSLNTGDSKSSVISKLLVTNAGKWNSNPASGTYIAIPMWGEIADITVNNTTAVSNPVNLVRMLSKIDVTVDTSLRANFKLTSIRLYNRYTQGSVAPLAANWDAGQGKVTAPSALGAKTTGPLVYTVPSPSAQYTNEIYTFEALAGAANTLGTNTCLVVGGIYGSDTNETFYRIDFANTSETTPVYLPLLRNHSYRVNIMAIKASGYATAAAAFAAKPVNIKAGITVWDDARITKMAYDGQYMLGVSDDDLTFTREARTPSSSDNILSVTTDVPGGWSVEKIVDASDNTITWLSLSPDKGTSGATVDTRIILEANPGAARVGYIHLSAGRLTYVVKVTQSAEAALLLRIRDAANTTDVTSLVFSGASGDQPAAQTLNLSWMPAGETVSVSTAKVGSLAFVYDGKGDTPGIGSGTSYTSESGTKLLSIQPTAFTPSADNPFEERISKVDFTLNNGINYLTKSVYLRQLVYNLIVDQPTSYYRLDGSTYTLNVRSNADWKIKSVSEKVTSGTGKLLNLQDSDNLKVGTTGGVNTASGTPVTFRVVNNTANLRGTLTIVFESTDSPKRFNDVTVVLDLKGEYYPAMHSGWAGSNIYWDGKKLTFDDVNVTTHRNYQGLYFQWGSLWGISPSGNWGTSTILYSPSGTSGTAASFGYSTWGKAPHVNDASITSNPPKDSGKTARDRAYLYEITDGAAGIGDICKYMTEKGWAPGSPEVKWRMPTSQEFAAASGGYTQRGTWNSATSNSASGQYQNTNAPGWTKANQGAPFFPAAGYRYAANGGLGAVGENGTYWSASPDGQLGYYVNFASNGALANTKNSRSFGFSIRCVRE